jgi:drug/metabolite transporter (DMT)-like permease
MVLTNKAITSALPEDIRYLVPQVSVVLFQSVVAVVLVEICRMLRFVDYPSFSLETAKSWIPLNLLFVLMLYSGFSSLSYLNVPMVMIFKNLTNVITVFGDWHFFGENITFLTIVSLGVMTIGAVTAGAHDLEFSAIGYFWMLINCISTAGMLFS